MIRSQLSRTLEAAVRALAHRSEIPDANYEIEIADPRDASHGDFSTNFALLNAKAIGRPPREVAELLAAEVRGDSALADVSVAGPGFINLRVSDSLLASSATGVIERGEEFARSHGAGERVLVEFVSVNPNGAIHVGHGRGAAYGDTLARLLDAAGNHVSREFYVNDGVNSEQMRLFALSVKAKYRELLGLPFDFPEDGYRGDDVDDVAGVLVTREGNSRADDGAEFFQPASQEVMIGIQREDLARFGVRFDTWFSEQSLHDKGEVDAALELLRKNGHTFEQDGAEFLRSTTFGDDKDRVVVRADGRPTYIASDIAYHLDKFERGFTHLIDVWGADHHGYIGRTSAAVQALGYERSSFEAIIVQIVRFLKEGEVVRMQKRTGDAIRLSELMDDVGPEAARYFYLMRSHDTHMDFDLDLAKEHSERNPLFYTQYAHARICSLLGKAAEQGLSGRPEALGANALEGPERALIRKTCDLPYEVGRAAQTRQVHRIATYGTELARQYHDFYEKCRVISPENPERSAARLAICEAARIGLSTTLNLLGVSAPEKM